MKKNSKKTKNKTFILTVSIATIFTLSLNSCKKDKDLSLQCLPNDLQNGVLAFYPFSQGSLSDFSGNNHHLNNTTSAKASKDRSSNSNCAFKFDHTNNEYLQASASNFLNNLYVFSVSLWYKSEYNGNGQYQILISRGETLNCADRRGEWSVGLYDCNRAVFGHNNSVWTNTPIWANNNTCEEIQELSKVWNHLVAVKENDVYRIYLNGVLQETATGNANCSPLYLAQDQGDLIIGKYFTGLIDDIIIYQKALSSSEVKKLHNISACCGK